MGRRCDILSKPPPVGPLASGYRAFSAPPGAEYRTYPADGIQIFLEIYQNHNDERDHSRAPSSHQISSSATRLGDVSGHCLGNARLRLFGMLIS